jgi:hypothetical protein
MINLNTTVFLFGVLFPFVRNLHKLKPLALTIEITKKHKSKGGKAMHTRLESTAHKHTSQDLSSKHSTDSSQLERSSNH